MVTIHSVSGKGSSLMPPVIAVLTQLESLSQRTVSSPDSLLFNKEVPMFCISKMEAASPMQWMTSTFTLRSDARVEAKSIDWRVTQPKRGTGTHSARSTEVLSASNMPNRSMKVTQLDRGFTKFAMINKPVLMAFM